MQGPQLAFSEELHAGKYRGPGETFRDGCYRQAGALKDDDDHYHQIAGIYLDQRFLNAGRIQAAMGALRETTPYNCFVSGIIEDSMVEGNGSIFQRLLEAAATMRMGGGIGYDFSTLRPFKDIIKSQQTFASGPVSFMNVFDEGCKTIASAGHRRGAQMAAMRVDHPDIETFINAKHPSAETQVLWEIAEAIENPELRERALKALQLTLPLTAFNMSVALTDEFMECRASGKPFPLRFGGQVYREVDPQALWDMIMRSTWDWAEPGALFIDTINRMNNLWYCETITTTNPCGEQPLPPNGACLLGSFNLPRYLLSNSEGYTFNWDQMAADIPPVVRALDNVVDRARYPLYEQKKEAQSKRRMGIGVTGLANALEAMGLPYGTAEFTAFEDTLLDFMTNHCYLASIDLAKEKGPFPLFDAQHYCNGQFIKTLNDEVQRGIAKHGIRNSHLTSIAPTGTISLAADNVSSGIEPVFGYSFDRDVITSEGATTERVVDYGKRVFGVEGRQANDVSVQHHLDVLCTAAQHMDSAVSKTLNVPGSTKWDEFQGIYVQAWERGCKGCTTFRMDGKRLGMIRLVPEDDAQASVGDVVGHTVGAENGVSCYVDLDTGRHECE